MKRTTDDGGVSTSIKGKEEDEDEDEDEGVLRDGCAGWLILTTRRMRFQLQRVRKRN